MKNRWRWLGFVALLLVCALVLYVIFDPNRVVRGFLAGEAFYKGRPTSYWRDVLRAEGEAGHVSRKTNMELGMSADALPVLMECARDPDVHVRWPAVYLLGRSGIRSVPVLDALLEAISDDEPDVRFQAIMAIGAWGRMARPAIPALIARLKDKETQVAHYGELALWHIDSAAAVKACGWRPFTSTKWNFTAAFPAIPQEETKPFSWGNQSTMIHTFLIMRNGTSYAVAVSEFPAKYLAGTSEEERVKASRDLAVFGLGGKLLRDDPLNYQGLRGREVIIEVGGNKVFRNRLFWVGNRLYQVNVAYVSKFRNPWAVNYFLDSFRLNECQKKK
jgi:hypothetical protein